MPDANRARVERLLSGDFRANDITRLFLFLRDRCDGRESVQEVGDFVAHHNERTKGLITRSTRDWSITARFAISHIVKSPDFNSLPADFPEFLRASLRRLGGQLIRKETGLSLREAQNLLPRIIGRFVTLEGGRFAIPGDVPNAHIKLIICLCEHLVSEPAFDDHRLFEDFRAALKSNGVLLKEEMRALEQFKPIISLFAVSVMHGCLIRLANNDTVKFDAVSSRDGMLVVEAAVVAQLENPAQHKMVLKSVDDPERRIDFPVIDNSIRFSSGMFDTSLRFSDCCEPALLEEKHPWDFALEVNVKHLLERLG